MLMFAGAASGQPQSTSELPRFAGADTVRTNLWLVRALMGEIIREAAASLPPPPAAVELMAEGTAEGNALFETVVASVLGQRGYTLYVAVDPGEGAASEETPGAPGSGKDETTAAGAEDEGAGEAASAAVAETPAQPVPAAAPESAAIDYELHYRLEQIKLEYPEAGRRFGIWRQWVSRELVLSAIVSVVDRRTGRLLLSDRIQRSFRDRVPDGLLASVRSDIYPFTDAQLQEGGWSRRLEEVVVLGTLTGLVAIYFANTGN